MSPSIKKYIIVCNHLKQYAIWPQEKIIPLGWNHALFEGTKEECIEQIKKLSKRVKERCIR